MDTKHVYQRVLAVANFFLTNASHLTIGALKDFDPTVEQIATDLRTLANLLEALASDSYEDQNMSVNAFECCLTMKQIADCVETENEQDYENLVKKLEMHTNAP